MCRFHSWKRCGHFPLYHLPTLHSILNHWRQHAIDKGFDMRDGLLWKEDVRNAFGQLTLDTPSVLRSCVRVHVSAEARFRGRAAELEIPAVIIVMMLRCYFGWCGASLAYNLLGTLVADRLEPAIEGVSDTYVDDIVGYGHPSSVRGDQTAAVGCIKGILGPDAHAADKQVLPCSTGEALGWTVDLPALTLLPSAKGRRKLLWAFFTVNVRARTWPLKQCQLLASLAHRYSVAMRGMALYVSLLDALLQGPSPGPRKASSAAR